MCPLDTSVTKTSRLALSLNQSELPHILQILLEDQVSKINATETMQIGGTETPIHVKQVLTSDEVVERLALADAEKAIKAA